MPSLSINNKDLDSLGINLKDLLKAISQTKTSTEDVIKIKKKKGKKQRKKRLLKSTSGMSKVANMNPFPIQQPKFSNYPTNGGGGGFPIQTKVEIKSEPQTQQQKQDEATKQQIAQLDQQVINIRQQQQIQNQGMNLTNQGVAYLIKNQQNQLMYHPYNTPFREPVVNRTDRFGVIAKNDFYENARTNEGIGIEITDAEPIYTEPQGETDTSIFKNVASEVEGQPLEEQLQQEGQVETQNVDYTEDYQQQQPPRREFTTPINDMNSFEDDTEEPLDLAQTLEQVQRGRGQRGKDKIPRIRRTKEQINSGVARNTRSQKNPLVEGRKRKSKKNDQEEQDLASNFA